MLVVAGSLALAGLWWNGGMHGATSHAAGPEASAQAGSAQAIEASPGPGSAGVDRAALPAGLSTTPESVSIDGYARWADAPGRPPRELDGRLEVVDANGRTQSWLVTDGTFRTRAATGTQVRVLGGRIEGRAVRAGAEPQALEPGVVLWLEPCTDRRLVATDEEGRALGGLRVCRGPVVGGSPSALAHPGSEEQLATLVEGASSPVTLEADWFGEGTLWVRAPGRVWRRVELDDRSGEELHVVLPEAGTLALQLVGEPSPFAMRLACRSVADGVELFELLQPRASSYRFDALPRARLELALVRPGAPWEASNASVEVDLRAGGTLEARLEWPSAGTGEAVSVLQGELSLADTDLPEALLARLQLQVFRLDEHRRVTAAPMARRYASRMQRFEGIVPSWSFELPALPTGDYAVLVHPLGAVREVSLRAAQEWARLDLGPLARTEIEASAGGRLPELDRGLRATILDPRFPVPLRAHLEEGPDATTAVAYGAPGELVVQVQAPGLALVTRIVETSFGWNHLELPTDPAWRVEVRSTAYGQPTSVDREWWAAARITGPSGARVLGMRTMGLPDRPGADRLELDLSHPGRWNVEFPSLADGRSPEPLAFDVHEQGATRVTVDVGAPSAD